MTLSLNVVILAAGQGKRMYSRLPKVLHPVAGKPMVKHVLDTSRQLSPAGLVVVYGHGGEQVQAALSAEPQLQWAHQAQQLGTGHAVQQALDFLQADLTLVLYGDVPLTRLSTLQRLVSLADSKTLAMLTDILDNPTGYGRIVRDAAGQVQCITEEKDADAPTKAIREINTGMMVFPTALLRGWLSRLSNNNAQGEYYLTDVIAMAVADGVTIATTQPDASWEAAGVNNKVQLAELERIFQLEQARELLLKGVTLSDPARLDVRGELSVGQDVSIDVNCVFEGQVALGDGVSIGANCVLRNVTIARGSQIAPFSHLDGAKVGEDARIGPYARLRPGASLANEVHVGNFVEIKNSVIGLGSKVNHLSYVGDADVGASVNVGAGTITCNYDGVNKFRTTIEDRVFVGSGSMLVAPVTLAAGATIGAGSTITKDAPAEQLTLERSKQLTLPSWKRPVKQSK